MSKIFHQNDNDTTFSRPGNMTKEFAGLKGTMLLIKRSLCVGFIALSIVCSPVFAQSTTADVVGTVTDSTGAVVPNAKVELTSVETHETRTLISGAGGEYAFTLLKPNHYSLKVTAPGFK